MTGMDSARKYVGIVFLCGFIGFGAGWYVGRSQSTFDVVAEAVASERAKITVEKSKDITDDSIRTASENQEVIKNATREIIKKVPVYITVKDDTNCIVSDSAARLFDEIAGGLPTSAVPATGTETEPAASVVTLTGIAEAEAVNYGYFQTEIVKCQALWDWSVKQAENAKGVTK